MKTILVLVTLLLVALDLYIPQDSVTSALGMIRQSHTCSLVYSEDEEGIVFENAETPCSNYEIRSLPPYSEGDTPFRAIFTKGSYTLKRALSVGVDVGYRFIVEDLLTGMEYDLKSDSSYHFNVSRTIPDRFVLHIKKDKDVTSK